MKSNAQQADEDALPLATSLRYDRAGRGWSPYWPASGAHEPG
ncbi:hypothetical protein GVAMD_0954 [Gardnerella vaginalis AMD]|nr:hypothetical protein GVAMD_0954 [Gardnerella vaginalis AMD]